jgi:hypothetical protein
LNAVPVTPIRMTPISNTPQPEPKPSGNQSPPLWLYLVLLIVSASFVFAAFRMNKGPDWAGLLLNLASDLIVTIIILVVIDRRLREPEVATLKRLPLITSRRFVWLISPTERLSQRYARKVVGTLEPLIAGKLELQQFPALEDKVRKGFVLMAGPGAGKTTWTQFTAVSLSQKYVSYDSEGRVPILFSLVRWLPDRSLHDALHESFASYTKCWRWSFNRLLRSGNVVVLLDGYDKLWKREVAFTDEIKKLRLEFPTVAWTVISRADKPVPPELGESEPLAPPTAEELEAIRRRQKTSA